MKKLDRIYVDFHVIQTVPPSCVNRDDTGSPKTALYGGVRRARVSSQSWKRAMREMFCEDLNEKDLGIRTKRVVGLVKEELLKIRADISEQDAESLAERVVKASGLSTEKKKNEDEEKTKALGVENEVVLLGTKTNPYPYLKQADLYVQTSIHEGFCITLGEAKSFGIPIISTEFAGAHEQLDGQKLCAVVQRSAIELFNAILQSLNKQGESQMVV